MGTQNECSERTHGNSGDRIESNDTFVDRVSVSKAFPAHTITPPLRGSRRSQAERRRLMRWGGGSISRILFRIDRAYGGDHVSTAYVTISLQRPTREPRSGRPLPNVPTHLRTRRSLCKAKQAVRCVLLFGLAPGDAYPAIHVAADAVGSYPTISPLPLTIRGWSGAVYFLWRSCRIAPPGRYPAPCPVESGLSSHPRRASGHLTHPHTGNHDTQCLCRKQETGGREHSGNAHPSTCS